MNEKENLERLSGIMKGILKYKEEQELLRELILKYKSESMKIFTDQYGYWFCTVTAEGQK